MFFNLIIITLFILAAFARKKYTMILYPVAIVGLLLSMFGFSSIVLLYFLITFLLIIIFLLSIIEYCYPTTEVSYKRFSYIPYILFTMITVGVLSIDIYHLKSKNGLIDLVTNFNVDTYVDMAVVLKFSVILIFLAFISLVNLEGDENA